MVTKFRRQPTTEATKCVSAGYEDRLHYLPKPVAEVDIESPGSIRGFLFALRSTKRRLDALVSSDWWSNCVGFLTSAQTHRNISQRYCSSRSPPRLSELLFERRVRMPKPD